MLERLASRLLWDKGHLAPKWLKVWGAVIVLAPLAAIAAIYFHWSIEESVAPHIRIDRATAIEKSRKLLEDQGCSLAGWNVMVRSEPDDKIYRYLLQKKEAAKELLAGMGPWATVTVEFAEETSGRKNSVLLSASGEITSYKIGADESDEMHPTHRLAEADARALAEAAIRQRMAPFPYLALGPMEVTRQAGNEKAREYTFRWKVTANQLPDLEMNAEMKLRGSEMAEYTLRTKLSDEAAKSVRGPSGGFAKGVFIPYCCVLFVLLTIRYFKRRMQKEVSRQRMLLVALTIAGFIIGQVMLMDVGLKISGLSQDVPLPWWIPLLLVTLGGVLMGQVAGVAYAASEGDLREARPRMLTSLDALLCGHLLSRNVGRSVVCGLALMAWMLAARGAVFSISQPERAAVAFIIDGFEYLFSRQLWLSLVLGAATAATLVCVSGLMAPMSVIDRRVKKKWAFYALAPCLALAVSFAMDVPVTGGAAWIVRLIYFGGLAVAFFGVDLLAALVMVASSFVATALITLVKIAPSWDRRDDWAIGLGLAVVAIQTVIAFRGRIVSDEGVRPAYAREIQERMQLESEVEAAKEAQLRLLPAGPPRMPGLELSASCQASEKVSGDFYDFFPISSTKVGIFICDGGGNGLATALTIALAKGYLMEKAHANVDPMETMRGLEATLGRHLQGISADGICYLVLDVRERTLRYARYGETPAILLAGGNDSVDEKLSRVGGTPLWEGSARLSDETRVIIYTNGLSRLVGERDRSATNRWLTRKLGGLLWQPAAQLHDSVVKAIFARTLRGKRKASDDVTVVVCSIDGKALHMEQVA